MVLIEPPVLPKSKTLRNGWSRAGPLSLVDPLHPPPLVVPTACDLFEPDYHHAAVRREGQELRFQQIGDGARHSGAELRQGLHGHARHMPVQPLVKHGVHPDRSHDGLAWIIVAAAFAEVVGA